MPKKKSGKLPFWPVYPGDVFKDSDLKLCSRPTQAVWFWCMNLMWECEERGVLAKQGKALTFEQVAALIPGDQSEALLCLRELVERSVFSTRKNGAIYSRRMVAEEEKRKKSKADGKKGGNPKLVNPGVNPPDNLFLKYEIDLLFECMGVKKIEGGGGAGEGYESTPRGSVNHPVIQALRKTNPRIRWVALEQGVEPPSRVADTMAAVDQMVVAYGLDAVVAALAAVGGVSVAEARPQANRALAGQKKRENLGRKKYEGNEF